MTALDRLLKTLAARGLSVTAGAEPGQLLLCGPAAEKSLEVIEAVKAFKPDLLEWIGRKSEPSEAVAWCQINADGTITRKNQLGSAE